MPELQNLGFFYTENTLPLLLVWVRTHTTKFDRRKKSKSVLWDLGHITQAPYGYTTKSPIFRDFTSRFRISRPHMRIDANFT